MKKLKCGIDLGGTKTEVGVLDESGKIVFRSRKSTPHESYSGIVETIHELVQEAEQKLSTQFLKIGVGTPGVESAKTGLIKNSNTLVLIGNPLRTDLEKKMKKKVQLANDANCFALSETVDGAASGFRNVFGIILGTGVGAGIVIEGKIVEGKNRIAGEWGHNPLPWMKPSEFPGPTCYCGRLGCIETFVSGTGLARDFNELNKTSFTGEEITQHILKKGEYQKPAIEALTRYEDRLARALSHVINLLDPEIIVLGGGVSNLDQLAVNIPKLFSKYVFSNEIETKVVQAKFGDSSGVRGAAWLVE